MKRTSLPLLARRNFITLLSGAAGVGRRDELSPGKAEAINVVGPHS